MFLLWGAVRRVLWWALVTVAPVVITATAPYVGPIAAGVLTRLAW